VSTRSEPKTRGPQAGAPAGANAAAARLRQGDAEEVLANVAAARRELLIGVHRRRLRREDLEDCYSQATLELLVAVRGGRAFASRLHVARALELRFVSRVHDRRRALAGRSPMHAALERAHVLGGGGERQPPGPIDRRAQPDVVAVGRHELRRIRALAEQLSDEQRTVIATQVGLGKDLPYGPGGHPDPRGAPEEDCSSTLNYVLYRAGVRPIGEIVRENPLAQDYVQWGTPGPGRWITIYATAAPVAHVFVVIAGLRLDTSHNGTDVGPNNAQDGPRWRVLDRIPTWANWSVRHPPGL